MPTRYSKALMRARYARTSGDMLVGGYDGPGINPSDQPPIWWMGVDSGGGSYPIGPNGPYTYGSGEALPVVTRATSLITGPLTAAPFRVLELGFGGQPLGRPRWVTDPMLCRDDGRFGTDIYPAASKISRGNFWAEWIRSACWYGLGAFICQEDNVGQPMAGTLRLVDPRLLFTTREDGVLCWTLGADGSDQAVFDRNGFLQLGPISYRLVVLRNPHSSVDSEGMSMGTFAMSPRAFGLSDQIDTYASGTFRSGIPAGYLKVTTPGLAQEGADDLKASWLRNHGGDRRSIAVLNATTEFVPLNLSPVDAALGEVKRLSIADVAMAFALDPMTLGAGLNNSATYTNLRDAWSNHKDFGLAPWIGAVQDTLSSLLPGTQGIAVDLDRFANPPLKERVETGKLAVEAGLMTRDEWRSLEGLPPLTQQERAALTVVPPSNDQPDQTEEAS